MPEIVHFHLERFDNDGVYYLIEGIELALVTDGHTIEEALRHLHEAVELYYEDEAGHVPPLPRLEVEFEVTPVILTQPSDFIGLQFRSQSQDQVGSS